MVERYPHTLDLTWQEDGRFSATSGDYVQGTAQTDTLTGRAEANGKGAMVRLADGSQVVYDWAFYCQPTSVAVDHNTEAVLYNAAGDQVWSGTVKRLVSAQLHAQIWL